MRRTSFVPVAHAGSRVVSSDSLRAPRRVHHNRHAADLHAVRGLRHHHLQGLLRGELVHDIPCGPCPTKIASLCISWVRRHSSVVCASTLGTHTGTGPSSSCLLSWGHTVMRWRRRPRKRSIAFTTGSLRPSTSSCPVGGCPVSARNSPLSCGRVDRQHEQHFRRPEADPCSGHVSLRSRERARCGGHRCVPASWHCTVRPLDSG